MKAISPITLRLALNLKESLPRSVMAVSFLFLQVLLALTGSDLPNPEA
jgi:hypothetical protein